MVIQEIFDVNEIVAVHKAIFGKPFPYDSYLKKLENYKVYFYAYYENSKIVGYSSVIDEADKRNLYAWYGGLISEYQGNGVTVKFFDILVERAKCMDYKTVTLATTNCRPHMLRLAIKYGFDIYDIKKRDYGEGNKIYFKFYITNSESYNIDLRTYISFSELEKKLVLAYKLNCNKIIFENFSGDSKEINLILYAIKYCKSFIRKPVIVVNGENEVIEKALLAYNQ